jgi:hypothetical protein
MITAVATGRGCSLRIVEHRVVAAIYNAFMWPQDRLFLRRQCARTAGAATGAVLEFGVGTGLKSALLHLSGRAIGIAPDPLMLTRARRRVATPVPGASSGRGVGRVAPVHRR